MASSLKNIKLSNAISVRCWFDSMHSDSKKVMAMKRLSGSVRVADDYGQTLA